MAIAQTHPHESKIYYELSHLYDRIFTRIFYPRIEATVCSLNIPPAARVLEVGVGTGLSLPSYPRHAEVVGIDLAPEMLEQAQEKVTQQNWSHIRLMQMDALHLEFPSHHFDYVTGFHVVSVVPDHLALLREMVRVCKPGGTVVVINHFRSPRWWLAPVVDRFDPLTRKLGWRTTLRFSEVFGGHVPLRVERRYKTSPRSLFTVVVARRS